jgi:hypothetical protein
MMAAVDAGATNLKEVTKPPAPRRVIPFFCWKVPPPYGGPSTAPGDPALAGKVLPVRL